ncbi:ubiquitin carboxyl-terminal hydrolase 47 isoform X3 [Hyalella azteca]|uniref:Ubiquitin carboxyl-terminal hydrolase 47 n=1 Tax=Hyalella azteca TaxID=294128 RepID=A0A8B7NGS6_HYAAZ|nr:ubiquitin carboxyl-terminal hydrolase 47 isoform X3 [Hyalella azteca]
MVRDLQGTTEGSEEGTSSTSSSSTSSTKTSSSRSSSTAPVLKLKGSITNSIASKFGGTAPAPALNRSLPRRESVGSVNLKKFETNASSTGVEFTAIKLKKVSKISSTSTQEDRTKVGVGRTVAVSVEDSFDVKKTVESSTGGGREVKINVTSISNNDKKDDTRRLEVIGKKIQATPDVDRLSQVRIIPVDKDVDCELKSTKLGQTLEEKPDAIGAKSKLLGTPSKLKREVEASGNLPCLKLSGKPAAGDSVSSVSTATLSSSSTSSRTSSSEINVFTSSNSLCRSATIKSTELPTIASQATAGKETNLGTAVKKPKKLLDGAVKKKKIKPKGEVIDVPIILESAAESPDTTQPHLICNEQSSPNSSGLNKTEVKIENSSIKNGKQDVMSDDNVPVTKASDPQGSMEESAVKDCTEATMRTPLATPEGGEGEPLQQTIPGVVAFPKTPPTAEGSAKQTTSPSVSISFDDMYDKNVPESMSSTQFSVSPSASVSNLSTTSPSGCSVPTASSSPICSLSTTSSSSSPSICSLSSVSCTTETLSTSISPSASDLSASPPPTCIALPLNSTLNSSCATTPPASTSAVPSTSRGTSSDPVILIVRDMSSVATNINRTTMKAPASSTIGALFAEIGHKFGYESDSFSLSLQSSTVTDPLERLDPWLTLEEAGFLVDGVSRNSLLLMDLRHGHPKRTDAAGTSSRDDELALGASASPSSCGGDDSGVYSSSSGSTRSKKRLEDPEVTHEYTSYSSSSSLSSKHDTGYVGLVNQAMTCYLNSLLQTLFMTPEFRNALYRWEFKGTKEEGAKSIPYQLQKLFLLLQTADRSAVETTSLTKSFGWDSSEAWQQHDIQELCRVMFEALEQSFANTDQANLIDTLYQGKMKDYVKCLRCGTENARVDSFLDIPLPIRPFGSSAAYQSLEEALRAFVAPELLTGNNQYQCSRCNEMCDAHKGLKFTKYPYLLTIHLKRFDFDYQTFLRIKLNDRVTFPNVLDLSEFLDENALVNTKCSNKSDSAVSALDDSATDDSGSALDMEESSVDLAHSHNCEDDEGIEVFASDTEKNLSNEMHKNSSGKCYSNGDPNSAINGPRSAVNGTNSAVNESSKVVNGSSSAINGSISALNGPCTVTQSGSDKASSEASCKNDVNTDYQLFSIMIHSGSASGGHYYAYIKDFLTGDWFCFNDQSVTRIGDEEIKRTYGGGGRTGGSYGASANAYMLMYRQCNEDRNLMPFTKDNFPAHIQKLCENLMIEEELEKELREREKSTCVIRLFCHHPAAAQLTGIKLHVNKNSTLAEATELAHEQLGLQKHVPLERCRLVKYEEYHDSIESSFEGQEDKPFSEIVGGVKSSYKFDLLLEVRDEHQQFEAYQPGSVSFKVFVVSLDGQGEVEGPFITRGLLSMTVAELKKAIASTLNLKSETMRIASEGFYEEMKFLSDDAALLRTEGFYKSNKLFVEASGEESTNFYMGSQMASIIERYHNTITLYCTLPVVTPDILAELNIPPFVEDKSTSTCETSFAVQAQEPEASEPQMESLDAVGNASRSSGKVISDTPPCSFESVSLPRPESAVNSFNWSHFRNITSSFSNLVISGTSALMAHSASNLLINYSQSTSNSANLSTQPDASSATSRPKSCPVTTSTSLSTTPVCPSLDDYISADGQLLTEPTEPLGQTQPFCTSISPGLTSAPNADQGSTNTLSLISAEHSTAVADALSSSAESVSVYSAMSPLARVHPSSLASFPSPSPYEDKTNTFVNSSEKDNHCSSAAVSVPGGAKMMSLDVGPRLAIASNASCTSLTDVPSAPAAAEVCAAVSNLSDDEDGADVCGGPHSALSSDQSTSEDSSLTSDSDRTLVGDPPDDERLSEGGHSPDYHNVSSPEENNGSTKDASTWSGGASCWASEETAAGRGWWQDEDAVIKRYFKAEFLPDENDQKVLQIRVDKRMTVDQLKLELQPYVGVGVQHFKLYKKFIQEFECNRGGEQLNFGDCCKLGVKLDRALQVGEFRGKVYLLDLTNNEEPAKFLIEFVMRENDTVSQAKAAILAEVKARLGLELKFEDVRLRRKSWKNPQSVYLDHQVFSARDIALHSNWELYLQELKGPEPKMCEDDLVLFIRRWRPSVYQVDPIEEIVLPIQTAEALRETLGRLSGISSENVEFARGTGPFPHNLSVFDISTKLSWVSGSGPLEDKPYNLLYDGVLVYYRDKDEQLGVLSDSERSEVEAADNKRLNKDSPYPAAALPSKPAREKGLKIYFKND